MLQDLIKKHFGDDEAKMTAFLEDMKTNKIYTASEENLDTRYSKLKGDYEALTTKEQEAQNLIAELKKTNAGNEALQAKVAEYETKIADLEKQNEALTIDNEIKFELLAAGAKASDIDYLIYRIRQGDDELKLDKEGKLKGLDGIVENMRKNYPGNFETKAQKKVNVLDLEHGDDDEDTVTKEQFDKMGYAERTKLYNENKELYEKLRGE